MAGFEEKKSELEALGIRVWAASVDPEDKAREVVDSGVSLPIAYGVTRDDADRLGSWWDARRNFIQPSEFLINGEGRILQSSYSAGPLARLEAGDVISLVGFLEARKKAKQG